ncbi:Uncharacterised protein [uncultured Clostridium sp.]|nr:Uncharacterised protein [uncultured Clostridium sp.]
METQLLDGSLNPVNVARVLKHNRDFYAAHPGYFKPEGLLIFCGEQGSGKTLSAVQYVKKLCEEYPRAILCSNVEIHGLPPETKVVEYNGLDCLKSLENGYYGVIYLIDEIHLEFNSLESKNIDIEVMIEVSQQRKQRKHIIGTSQVYGRLAKPFREQIRNVVLCSNFCKILQINTLIDGSKSTEKDGHLITDTVKRFYWFHRPELYDSYDTYAKMKRYKKEWQGRRIS